MSDKKKPDEKDLPLMEDQDEEARDLFEGFDDLEDLEEDEIIELDEVVEEGDADLEPLPDLDDGLPDLDEMDLDEDLDGSLFDEEDVTVELAAGKDEVSPAEKSPEETLEEIAVEDADLETLFDSSAEKALNGPEDSAKVDEIGLQEAADDDLATEELFETVSEQADLDEFERLVQEAVGRDEEPAEEVPVDQGEGKKGEPPDTAGDIPSDEVALGEELSEVLSEDEEAFLQELEKDVGADLPGFEMELPKHPSLESEDASRAIRDESSADVGAGHIEESVVEQETGSQLPSEAVTDTGAMAAASTIDGEPQAAPVHGEEPFEEGPLPGSSSGQSQGDEEGTALFLPILEIMEKRLEERLEERLENKLGVRLGKELEKLLVESLHKMIREQLPGMVRQVLREEIERLTKNLGA